MPPNYYSTLARPLATESLAVKSRVSSAAVASSSKPWRLSASVIIVAPHQSVPRCSLSADTGKFDYRVCCVRRTAKSSFMPDVMVFPGGAVESEDINSAKKLLGSDDLDATLRCAAIRETFEESGISLFESVPKMDGAELLDWRRRVREESGISLFESVPKMDGAELLDWRRRVREDPSCFRELCSTYDVKPASDSMHYWYSFITPDMEHERLRRGGFDARFFLCCATEEMVKSAEVDHQETVQLMWLAPDEALEAVREGRISMVPPQWYVFKELSEACPTFASIPRHAASPSRALLREYPIKPYLAPLTPAERSAALRLHGKDASSDEKVFSLCYPGDEAHPVFPGALGARHRMLMIGSLGGRLLMELERKGVSLPLKEIRQDWHFLAKL